MTVELQRQVLRYSLSEHIEGEFMYGKASYSRCNSDVIGGRESIW